MVYQGAPCIVRMVPVAIWRRHAGLHQIIMGRAHFFNIAHGGHIVLNHKVGYHSLHLLNLICIEIRPIHAAHGKAAPITACRRAGIDNIVGNGRFVICGNFPDRCGRFRQQFIQVNFGTGIQRTEQ